MDIPGQHQCQNQSSFWSQLIANLGPLSDLHVGLQVWLYAAKRSSATCWVCSPEELMIIIAIRV